jgi:hypothetical protein
VDIYVWSAVPPASGDFVALGDIVTTNHDMPNIPSYRCVHRALLTQKPLGQQIWNDKGSWGVGHTAGAAWSSPHNSQGQIAPHFFISEPDSFDAPAGTFYGVSEKFAPAASRFLVRATQDYVTEDDKAHFSFKTGDIFCVTYWDEGNPWWTAYPLRYPNGKMTTSHLSDSVCRSLVFDLLVPPAFPI